MRVNIQWLRELVDLSGISSDEIVKKMALHSIEIEATSLFNNSDSLVVGFVETKEKHPNADTLSLLQVNVGNEVLQIVCGAPNVAAGQYVIVAKEGTLLPGDFLIKRTKIRGIESCGMVCSLQELGIAKKFIDERYSDGIFYFTEPQTLGMKANKALSMDDYVIELGLTPNRGDLLSMIGVAYECSAVFNRPLLSLSYDVVQRDQLRYCNVAIETNDCSLYYGQIIRDVEIKPSPTWLISRLIAFGIRPINNCVDITNYILALYGQPLHAFDFDILGDKVVVRKALQNEVITTLDEVKRNLMVSDIVITDGTKPVAIAGVMGGQETEVTKNTQNILLEAAVFDPASVRATSFRLGLRSESSLRFERGVDVNRTKQALDHACFLFSSLANGKIDFCGMDGITHVSDKEILLTKNDVESHLGCKTSQKQIEEIFKRLHFSVAYPQINVPNRRSDITIKEDLIEEFARIYGYDQLPITYPLDNSVGYLTDQQKTKRLIEVSLTHLGLYQTITYALTSTKESKDFLNLLPQTAKDIALLMPLSEERQLLRKTLLPSLIEVARYNALRKIKDVAVFEMGHIYYMEDNQVVESLRISGVLMGTLSHTLWQQKEEKIDFYVVKGILDYLFSTLKLDVTYRALNNQSLNLHPHRSAEIIYGDEMIGFVGQLHPKYAQEQDIDEAFVFELDGAKLIEQPKKSIKFQTISKLPHIERDIAIVVKKDVLVGMLLDTIRKSDKTIANVILFDIYQGENVAKDEKSIAIRLVFVADEAMTEDSIAKKVMRILKTIEYHYQAKLRS